MAKMGTSLRMEHMIELFATSSDLDSRGKEPFKSGTDQNMDWVMEKNENQQKPEERTKRCCRRVVLVPCPFQGHINPMIQLASILRSRGFSITIAHTIFNSPKPSNHPQFTFCPFPDNLPDTITSDVEDAIYAILHVNANCGVHLREILAKMDDLVCVIFDEMMFFADPVAKSLNIPGFMLRTCNAAVLVARLTLVKFKDEGRFPVPESKMNEIVPELCPLRYKDLQLLSKFKNAESFWEMIINMSKLKASAIIINTVDGLEHEQILQLKHLRQVPIFPTGPLHTLVPSTKSPSSSSLIEEDVSCVEWLDSQETNSVLYISLGSIASMKEIEVEEMLWGLINSDKPFLWVIRPEMTTVKIALRSAEGSKGKIIKWAPQKEVLAHRAVGAFWSHCGWNSTLESLSEGVPMICRPSFADQFINAKYISEVWKVGLTYEKDVLERHEVEKIVKKVMEGTKSDELRESVNKLKQKIEGSVAHDGPSVNALDQLVEFILAF